MPVGRVRTVVTRTTRREDGSPADDRRAPAAPDGGTPTGGGVGVAGRLAGTLAAGWPSRSSQRVGHLLLAALLGVYVYSPLGSVPAFALAVQVVAFPALALSGILLWRGGRVRAWLWRVADGGSAVA
jgi:hypothetical protein